MQEASVRIKLILIFARKLRRDLELIENTRYGQQVGDCWTISDSATHSLSDMGEVI